MSLPWPEAREGYDSVFAEVPVQGRTFGSTVPAAWREHELPRKRSRTMSKWLIASPFVAVATVAVAAYAALTYLAHVLEQFES